MPAKCISGEKNIPGRMNSICNGPEVGPLRRLKKWLKDE